MSKPTVISINGVDYVKADARPKGNRAVVVVDRGWIFAGDVTEENGRVKLDRVVWLFRWETIGLDGVLKNPKSDSVHLRRIETQVDMPAGAEVYRIPVSEDWGL